MDQHSLVLRHSDVGSGLKDVFSFFAADHCQGANRAENEKIKKVLSRYKNHLIVTDGMDRTSSMSSSSVLRLYVDKSQGFWSGILVSINRVLPVQ